MNYSIFAAIVFEGKCSVRNTLLFTMCFISEIYIYQTLRHA